MSFPKKPVVQDYFAGNTIRLLEEAVGLVLQRNEFYVREQEDMLKRLLEQRSDEDSGK